MNRTENNFLITETGIRETLRRRLADFLYKSYTSNTAAMVARDVNRETGADIPTSTISKWLLGENSPSPERQLLLEITYPDLSAYTHAPFKSAHRKLKERELEKIIEQSRRELAELRSV